jgi:hypothetical protein
VQLVFFPRRARLWGFERAVELSEQDR